MPTQLTIFNGALVALSQRELTSLTDPVESRRTLERVWDRDFLNGCLETGDWNFATRSAQLDAEVSAPDFGFEYKFQKPTDWVRTSKVSAEPNFNTPLNDYTDEGGYWYANFDPIYVRYISNDVDFGGNLSAWPESFTRYAELQLAVRAAPRILGASADSYIEKLEAKVSAALKGAKAKDAHGQPVEFPPLGSWARSRSLGSSNTKNG